jgi:hypothetical protein
MSFFSIETFYFLSMGIVGILIIMLIFHFRNKIVLLEKQVQGLHSIASELVNDVRRVHVAQPFGLGVAAAGLDNFLLRPSFSQDDEDVPPLVIGSEAADLGLVVEEPVFEPAVLKTVSFQSSSEPVQEVVSEPVLQELSEEPFQNLEVEMDDDDKTVATVEGASLPLKKRHVSELRSIALSAGIEGAAKMKKAELVALLSTGPLEPVASLSTGPLEPVADLPEVLV